MQPFSSTHAPLTDVTSNPYLDEPAKTNPTGTLGKFAVAVQSGITSFFSSLSPNYIPEHQRQTSQPTAPVVSTLPADNKNDKTSLADNFVQGVGLASKALSCWVPNVSAVTDAIGTICSYVSLANSLDNMAVSGKSGKSGKEQASGSENVSKHHSQKVTDKKQEDEKPGKPVTASGTANRVSGPAMATATLMAMDRLAGAAALPAEGRPGAWNNPILVEDSATLSKIGRNDSYPMAAYYQQTRSFSHNTSVPVGSDSKPFKGHYDGGCHTISDLQDCLFGELGSGADVKNLRIANAAIDQPGRQHSAVLACEMSGGSAVSDVRIEHGTVSTSKEGRAGERTRTGGITGLLGKESVLKDIEIVNCSVTSSGRNTHTGAGGGWVDGDIERMTVRDSQVSSAGPSSPAAIGGGLVTGHIKQLTVINSQVTTTGTNGHAAIGGGQVGRVFPPVAGKVSELVALNSHVKTENTRSVAAIGGGLVAGQQSEINGITAIDCSVSASHDFSWVAIGAGWNLGQVADTTAVNSSVTGRFADIGKALGSGNVKGTASLNSRVNGEPKNLGNVTLPGLCRTADARFVTSDCQLNPDSLTEDHWNCSSTSTATSDPVPQPTTLPITETVTANPMTQPATDALTTPTTMHKTALSHTTTPLPGSKPLTGTPAAPDSLILVPDSETLGKIGQPGYPLNGHYLQTKSFSHNSGVAIGNEGTPFTGDYDGGCHTISDPEGCPFGKLGRDAVVHDLHVANAAIKNSDSRSAALACEMSAQSTVRDIFIEDTSIINERVSDRSDLASYTGVISGFQQTDSLIVDADVKNCSVTTTGDYSPVGIGSGKTEGQMKHINVADSQVNTSGLHSDAGIGAGIMAGLIKHLAVTGSRVETLGHHANAGIGGGKIEGDIEHLTVLSSNVNTDQFSSDAGIGGGEVFGDIRDMTVVKSRVTTYGALAHAAIGGGKVGGFERPLDGGKLDGSVNDLVALDSHVRTEGRLAFAGIGGGFVNGEVGGVSAINCSVSTADKNAGIGAGYDAGSTADIRSLNSRVNGELQNLGSVDSSELCRTADSRFVTDDCQLTPESLTEDHWHWNCSATSIAATPAYSHAVRQYSPQIAASSINNTPMADTTSQQPAMTSLNKTTMDSTTSPLSSHTMTTPAPFNKTTMDSITSPLSSHTLTNSAPFNKTAMDSTASPLSSHTLTTPAPLDKTTMNRTTSPLSSHTLTTPAPLDKTAMDSTTSSPLSSHTLTTSAPFNKTTMESTASPLSSHTQTNSAPFNKTAMDSTTSPLSSHTQTNSAPFNKTAMDSTTSPLSSHTQTNSAPFNKTAMDSTTSPLSSHTLTNSAPFNKTAMDSTTSPLSSHTQTTPAPFNKTTIDSAANPLSSHTQTTQAPFNKTTMDSAANPLSSHTQTTPVPLGKTAMANTSTPLSSPALTTPALLNEMVMSNTTITGNTISTPLPSINATITTTTPLATAAMTTTAPVTETVVTLPEASMTFSGMPPATALPITPAPLAGTISTGVVLGVSLGTAVTILAGIGLCALYQHYHRRDEAQQPADPEIPLEHLNQQANN
ncbi:hypothetical protein J7438_02175 [Thalassotalea sp. G20_0]|uniref:hypothetical protein n=1 Tax=Thalassotalea sp. G20_0 TaxID=2821093 RepID=UPI001ADAB454|nr:hypothetical protein [Thalassotalea sp. G20_0]MBO9492901.1 hypothetical protein [Thalassotalea sp. G20_0]